LLVRKPMHIPINKPAGIKSAPALRLSSSTAFSFLGFVPRETYGL
jgi:hypothetical protein